MRYWWVNQNPTFKHEVQGGFLWSPKTNRGGGRNPFYDNMPLVRAGDIVLSFYNSAIRAVGVALGSAESATKPEFGSVGDQWDDEGWYVPVEFSRTADPVRPKDIIDELTPYLAAKYAPLQPNGSGNQGVYLTEVSRDFTTVILEHLGLTIDGVRATETADVAEQEDDEAQAGVQGRTDIGATQKSQLINARRGQGIFRANVRLNETGCRVTGVSNPDFLIASHIKPWRNSDDQEKLDGCNGLLLSPHVDRLFDRGLISFDADGTLHKSGQLPQEVWASWGLGPITKVAPFTDQQATYLAFHRAKVFRP